MIERRIIRSARRAGVVLVTALWVLGILTALAWSLVYRVRLGMAVTDYRSDETEARALLESGLARALWGLRIDFDREVDHLGEGWALQSAMVDEGLVDERYLDQREPVVRWRAIDEGGKLNVNFARSDVIASLLVITYGAEIEGERLASFIADWIDRNDDGPAERNYYQGLDDPYSPRNGFMTAIEELLTVRAVSPWLFFGEDTNGNGQLDAWENDGARQPPFDNEDGSLQPGLRDLLTVMGDGTLNVNTAPVQTLEALFRSLDSLSTDDASEMARSIGTKRAGPDGVQGTEDDTPFSSTSEIAEVTGLGIYQQCRSAGVPLGVASPAFTIDVHVAMEADRIEMHARGLVARQTNGLRLAYWRRE